MVSRTLQGLFLLLPDAHGELRRIIAGVIGHARETYDEVRVHAAVFLSNHFQFTRSSRHALHGLYVRQVLPYTCLATGARIVLPAALRYCTRCAAIIK
mgnify:CR=1 FL=1